MLGPAIALARRGLPQDWYTLLKVSALVDGQIPAADAPLFPPPYGSWVYELTDWGADLGPVLVGLARWSSRWPAGVTRTRRRLPRRHRRTTRH